MWVYPPTNIAVLICFNEENEDQPGFLSFFLFFLVVAMGPRCSAPVKNLRLNPSSGTWHRSWAWVAFASACCGRAAVNAWQIRNRWNCPWPSNWWSWDLHPMRSRGLWKMFHVVIASPDGGMCNGKHGVTVRKGISFVTVCICLWHVFGKISKISHVLEMFHGLVMWKRYFSITPWWGEAKRELHVRLRGWLAGWGGTTPAATPRPRCQRHQWPAGHPFCCSQRARGVC